MKSVSSSASSTPRGPKNRRVKGALGKRAKRKMATKKKLDEPTILRRINKLAGTQKSIPNGACWTSATLPVALRSCAKQYYVQFGTQVARANAKIVIDPVWTGAVAKLVYKYSTAACVLFVVFRCLDIGVRRSSSTEKTPFLSSLADNQRKKDVFRKLANGPKHRIEKHLFRRVACVLSSKKVFSL